MTHPAVNEITPNAPLRRFTAVPRLGLPEITVQQNDRASFNIQELGVRHRLDGTQLRQL
jgi:hypothetical protein